MFFSVDRYEFKLSIGAKPSLGKAEGLVDSLIIMEPVKATQ